MADEWREHVARLDGRVDTVQAQLDTHVENSQQRWADNEKDHDLFTKKIDRPTWAVTTIISFLSSVCVGLIVYVVTH